MILKPTAEQFFFSKHDPEDPRLGEFVSPVATTPAFRLLGYCDDDGIRLNGGRVGAAEAPLAIRNIFYRMTPSRHWPRQSFIEDCGNFFPQSDRLEKRHATCRKKAEELFQSSSDFLLTLGGGHDYGYPDGAAFLSQNFSQKPVIINFDAHLDVRPVDRGLTSGTPFRRLIEEFPNAFDLLEIGLQPQCNSPFHWEWALAQGVKTVPLAEIRAVEGRHVLQSILQKLVPEPGRPLWLSLDIDAFSSREAPGCSASWPSGLNAEEVTELWPWLFEHFQIRGLGIYEVSPPLDVDSKTTKLAALMAYNTLGLWIEKTLKGSGS